MHASNASSVLSNRKKFSESEKYCHVSVKRDMSKLERQEESLLLKERFLLIKTGTLRKDLRIRRNQLFVRNVAVGSVIDKKYVPVSVPDPLSSHSVSDQTSAEDSPQPIITPHDNQSLSHQPSSHS